MEAMVGRWLVVGERVPTEGAMEGSRECPPVPTEGGEVIDLPESTAAAPAAPTEPDEAAAAA